MTVTAPLFLPVPPGAVDGRMPDYLRRLNVALQGEHTQLAAAINAINLGIQNLDGGAPDSVFTATQHVDGGTA